MAATLARVQSKRKQIVSASRLLTWAMLAVGLLVTLAGFIIQSAYDKVHWSRSDYLYNYRSQSYYNCFPRITIPKVYEQYWCGFLVVFTALIQLASPESYVWLKIKDLLRISKTKCFVISVLLSMFAGLAVMTHDGETLGSLRSYLAKSTPHDMDCDRKNVQHLTTIMEWLYVVLLAASILVILCVVQFLFLLGEWTMKLILKIQFPECCDLEQEMSQLPPAYTEEPSQNCHPHVNYMPLQATESTGSNQQFDQRVPMQFYMPPPCCACQINPRPVCQTAHAHSCFSHAGCSQDNPTIPVHPQDDVEGESPQQQETNNVQT